MLKRGCGYRAWEGRGRLTDKDGPDVDECEQNDVCNLVQRKDEGKNVIRHALRKAIDRMESMARIRRWHNPLMMRLVQRPIHTGVV